MSLKAFISAYSLIHGGSLVTEEVTSMGGSRSSLPLLHTLPNVPHSPRPPPQCPQCCPKLPLPFSPYPPCERHLPACRPPAHPLLCCVSTLPGHCACLRTPRLTADNALLYTGHNRVRQWVSRYSSSFGGQISPRILCCSLHHFLRQNTADPSHHAKPST